MWIQIYFILLHYSIFLWKSDDFLDFPKNERTTPVFTVFYQRHLDRVFLTCKLLCLIAPPTRRQSALLKLARQMTIYYCFLWRSDHQRFALERRHSKCIAYSSIALLDWGEIGAAQWLPVFSFVRSLQFFTILDYHLVNQASSSKRTIISGSGARKRNYTRCAYCHGRR